DEAVALHDQAAALRDRGEPGRAEALCRQALQLLTEADGPDHPDVANVLNTLCLILLDLARYPEAEEAARRAAGVMQAYDQDGVIARIRVHALNTLGTVLRVQGRYAEAEPLFRAALAHGEGKLGPEDPDVLLTLNNLGVLGKYAGHFGEAEQAYR